MLSPRHRRPLAALLLTLAAAAVRADAPPDFGRDVLPILSDNCFHCHGQDAMARKADLRLDTKDGAAHVLKPGESELVRRVTSGDADEVMPPPKSKRKLSPRQVATLKKWVEAGAPWGKHWAFEPPLRPAVPAVANPNVVRNPIDAFVVARLEREGLQPSPEASPETLLRRLSLDLTGLPPTVAELDAFLADDTTGAVEQVVDRLLASPRFGERVAWDWLDAARYADTNGYQGDNERTMWPWRDWVVKAVNANQPYDRFTVEQLAGDLLPSPTREQKLATGFNRNHMINGEGGRIAEENRAEYVMDQAETAATVWLGLTLTCCRCHDHKYDPLTQKEYYGFYAYFNRTPVSGGGGSGQTKPVIDFAGPEQTKRRAKLQADFDRLTKDVRAKEAALREAGATKTDDGRYASTLPPLIESALRKGPGDRTPENRAELVKHYKESEPEYVKLLDSLQKAAKARDDFAKSIPQVMVMEDAPKPRATFVLARGAYDKPGAQVEPGVPASLPPLPEGAPPNRLALAEWLVDPKHPLTARVTVNRVWQSLFGTGLVKTAEDFGVQGERPSHPELLDWLAVEFVESGWDVKALYRRILTSATYRQSSKVSPALAERDPENRLLARGPRFRLPAWAIRDQALAASGLMTGTPGGPSVKPYQPPGIWEEATFGKIAYVPDKGEKLYRRSLYVFWRRIVGPTMFFDTASRQTCTVKAARTNTPLHALATLNDATYVEAGRALAQRVIREHPAPAERLTAAFRLLTSRRPTGDERRMLLASYGKMLAAYAADPAAAAKLLAVGDSPRDPALDPADHAATAAVCTMLLNLDEVLTKQ